MRYYTYKITFKDLPGYFYYGSHKNDGKPYFGSPKTWRRLWSLFDPEVQILQWYETLEEVVGAEESIIWATWGSKYSLNEHTGGRFSEEICRTNGKSTGASNLAKIPREVLVANGKANMTPERARKHGKETTETNLLPNCSKNGKSTGPGNGRATGPANGRANGPANARAVASQRWQCLLTGFVANPGNLYQYQRARGIDTSLRVRLED